jgi:hypothetical protein
MMTARQEALSNAVIMLHILSYEGPGSWLFVPPVSKLWKHCYNPIDPAPLRVSYPQATIRSTAYETVFQSPQRLH